MPDNIATTLLDFILDLLGKPGVADDYAKNPSATLAGYHLADVSDADVKSAMAAVLDCSPVPKATVANLSHGPSANEWVSPWHASGLDKSGATERPCPPEHHEHDHDNDVIKQLQTIQNTYNVSNTHEFNSVFAKGDAAVMFDSTGNLVSHSYVKGDVTSTVDNSHNEATGPQSVAGNGNDGNNARTNSASNGSVAGDGSSVDNSQHNTINTANGAGSAAGYDAHGEAQNSGNSLGAGASFGNGAAMGNGDTVDKSDHSVDVKDSQLGNGNVAHASNVGNTYDSHNIDDSNFTSGDDSGIATKGGALADNGSTAAHGDVDQSHTFAPDIDNSNLAGGDQQNGNTLWDHSALGGEDANSSQHLDVDIHHGYMHPVG